MIFPRPASPRAFWRDLRAFLTQRSAHQRIAAGLAVLMVATILGLFYLDTHRPLGPQEDIVYVKSWPATRTDADIRHDQMIAQQEHDAALHQRQQEYQRVQNSLSRIGF